jgi:excisionase family DNA binding protein
MASDMTTPQAAAILGVAVATIRSWTDTGELPHWRTPGGHRRFAEDDVLALRERRKSGERRQAGLRTTTWQRAALVVLHAAIADIGPNNELAQPFVRAAKEVRLADARARRHPLDPAARARLAGEDDATRGG